MNRNLLNLFASDCQSSDIADCPGDGEVNECILPIASTHASRNRSPRCCCANYEIDVISSCFFHFAAINRISPLREFNRHSREGGNPGSQVGALTTSVFFRHRLAAHRLVSKGHCLFYPEPRLCNSEHSKPDVYNDIFDIQFSTLVADNQKSAVAKQPPSN